MIYESFTMITFTDIQWFWSCYCHRGQSSKKLVKNFRIKLDIDYKFFCSALHFDKIQMKWMTLVRNFKRYLLNRCISSYVLLKDKDFSNTLKSCKTRCDFYQTQLMVVSCYNSEIFCLVIWFLNTRKWFCMVLETKPLFFLLSKTGRSVCLISVMSGWFKIGTRSHLLMNICRYKGTMRPLKILKIYIR